MKNTARDTTHSDLALMQSVLVGDQDLEIVAAEARLRSAQLAGDARILAEILSDELLFAGPDGRLASKAQDLKAHSSGLVRFREHEPEELQIRRLGASVAITALRTRLAVEVAGALTRGLFLYTRVWHRDDNGWRVAGGHVSEIQR
jgi:hypothetical protein